MFKRLWKKEDGQVLVMVALLLFVLLGFAALVIDVGYYYGEKRQLQTAVDAGALAGAIEAYQVKGDGARDAKVEEEVNTYLQANVEEVEVAKTIKIDWDATDITVAVDLTTKHPTFFARIFGGQFTDIFAHAKAIVVDRELPSSPYSIFSETAKVTFTGNHNTVVGGVYSKYDSNIDPSKVTITDGVAEWGTGQVLPDYSQLLTLPPTIVTENYFNANYIMGTKEVTGLIIITDNSGGSGTVSIKQNGNGNYLKGKGIIYSAGDLKINVPTSSDSSILYYSAGNITLSSSYIYGIVYAPNGIIELNGDPNIPVMGKLLAKNDVYLNGAKFALGYNESAEEWMDGISKLSKLIE